MQKEYKQFPLLDFKAANADDELGKFNGYASTWTKDSYGDVIAPGAFAQSIVDKRGKYPILFNHEQSSWIGFTTAMAEDQKGLAISAGIALKSSAGADAYALLKAADAIDFRIGLSIGFIATDTERADEGRILKTIELYEISLTPFPANQRAFVDSVKNIRDFEKALRDVGCFSVSESKRILAALAAAQLPAPARDVREVRTPPLAAPQTGIRSQLWTHL
jgi:HK97 family phage prohead protease